MWRKRQRLDCAAASVGQRRGRPDRVSLDGGPHRPSDRLARRSFETVEGRVNQSPTGVAMKTWIVHEVPVNYTLTGDAIMFRSGWEHAVQRHRRSGDDRGRPHWACHPLGFRVSSSPRRPSCWIGPTCNNSRGLDLEPLGPGDRRRSGPHPHSDDHGPTDTSASLTASTAPGGSPCAERCHVGRAGHSRTENSRRRPASALGRIAARGPPIPACR